MSSKVQSTSVERANIIYDRLKDAHPEITSDEKLGKKLAGIGKSGIKYRRENGIVKPDEIMNAFPDTNRDWAFSENIDELKKLPVLRKHVNDPKVQYADSVDISDSEVSRSEMKELLGQIEEIAKILKDSL